MEEVLADREANGERNGEARGRELILKLVSLMMRDGLESERPRLTEDAEYCEAMSMKYHLK